MAKRLREDSASSQTEDDDTGNVTRSPSAEPSEVHTPKYASLEPVGTPTTMRCSLPSHKPLTFSTYAEYESHYQQAHTNRCADCQNNFPTSVFLDLHIAENHDPILAAKREEGEKTYACFVEGCERVCSDWKKRRSHLVDKHGFPKNYDFLVVDHGIDGRRSMLRAGIDAHGHRKSSQERGRSDSSISANTQTTEATSVSEANGATPDESGERPGPAGGAGKKREIENKGDAGKKDDATSAVNESNIDDLTSSMSALKMVPRTVTFGQRKGRSGFAKS